MGIFRTALRIKMVHTASAIITVIEFIIVILAIYLIIKNIGKRKKKKK